jgi:hypothetical protein
LIANGLVAKVRIGDYAGALSAYYHPEIVSIEPAGELREVRGIDACRQKSEWWNDTYVVNGAAVEGPFVAGNQFVVRYTYDVTNRSDGQRSTFDELALYLVDGDRIVREQFFYHAPGL